jgi:hypothetical protein
MKLLLLVFLFFPLLAFCIAATAELQSESNRKEKVWNLIPIVLGIMAFGLSLDPQRFLHVTAASSITLSRIMTLVSAAIASSGTYMSYSRRSSSVWVAFGGLVLAFFWMFNRVLI